MPVFETLGVVLAVPGVIDVIVRGGEAVYEKVETFRTVDQAVNSFRQIALDITEGPVYFGLETLRGASKNRNVPASIKDQLDRSLSNLKQQLELSREGLDRVHENTLKGRLVYTLWRGKGSQHQLVKLAASLKASCDTLKDLCLHLQASQNGISSYFWTSDTFKVRGETLQNQPGQNLLCSDIAVAAGNYTERGIRVEADFILERKSKENDVRYLSSVLNRTLLSSRRGVLPVLGYRQPPYNEADGTRIFQLIIQLPQDQERRSLAHLIAFDARPSIAVQLKVCLSMAQALSSVHALGLVHKAIRPRAILAISNPASQDLGFDLFLQDWTCIRELSGATTQLGEDSWHKALYQHPERQGKYAEAIYESKHDIYSLGVNILEVLLWTPFVLPDPAALSEAPIGICKLFEDTAIKLGEPNGGLPERYRGDPMKLTSRPRAVKTTWCEVTKSDLVDGDLQNLVLNCLNEVYQDVSEVFDDLQKWIEARV